MSKPHFDHPWIDNSNSPILAVKYADGFTDDDIASLMVDLEKWIAATKEPYGWVIDIAPVSAKGRKIVADSQNRRAQYERQFCTCYAYVVSNSFLRNIITAVLWMSPPPCAYDVFSNKAEAVVWARHKHAEVIARAQQPGQVSQRR